MMIDTRQMRHLTRGMIKIYKNQDGVYLDVHYDMECTCPICKKRTNIDFDCGETVEAVIAIGTKRTEEEENMNITKPDQSFICEHCDRKIKMLNRKRGLNDFTDFKELCNHLSEAYRLLGWKNCEEEERSRRIQETSRTIH